MKKLMIAMTAAAVALPAATLSPALAQRYDRQDQNRHDRDRHDRDRGDRDRHDRDRHRFNDWRSARNYDWNRPERGYRTYYADRYYRPGPVYVMTRGDRIYRGYDGHYYCRRRDGTTGLIVGATLGAVLGSQLRVGGSQTLSTILGGAAGAALGRSIDRGRLRCR